MKAITVKQPYAKLIASGIKNIENRTWKTNYRGRILIHAASNSCTWQKVINTLSEAAKEYFMKHGLNGAWVRNLEKGAIIGSVEIVDCVRDSSSIWALPDHWHWVLANPVLFDEPIRNVKGKLSFWNYPVAKVVPLDDLCSVCGYFTSQTDANNHYGCNHPEQSETDACTEINGYYAYDKHGAIQMGKCYSFSCPLATECDLEDLRDHSKDYYDEWKNAKCDPAEAGAQLMLVFDKDLIEKL